MAYVPSLREIPLSEEPHASVIAALMPDVDSEDGTGVDWASVTEDQRAHLEMCMRCRDYLGGVGRVSVGNDVAAITPRTIADIRANLTKLHNQKRASYGRKPLIHHATLSNMAQGYANQVADKNWWSSTHTRPNGWTFMQWWNATAPAAWCCGKLPGGENLARYQRTNAEVMRDWWNSTAHRNNILNAKFTHVGFGVADNARNGNRYWVAHFLGANGW